MFKTRKITLMLNFFYLPPHGLDKEDKSYVEVFVSLHMFKTKKITLTLKVLSPSSCLRQRK